MFLKKIFPHQALNKAYRKVKPSRDEFDPFQKNLEKLLDQTNDTESEEHHKNLVIEFLKDTWYGKDYYVNTKERTDLVIHTDKKSSSPVGVIVETKKPTNSGEMVTKDDLNRKAFHELILYYLRERITQKNLEIKHVIATNIHEWFVFDANIFEKIFAKNKKLVNHFEQFEAGKLSGTDTSFFYNEIAKPFVADLDKEIPFTYVDLRSYEKLIDSEVDKDKRKLINLFKLFSPEHLLKLPFANDSNSLDKRFYAELLHIIGLTETGGNKKLIERKAKGDRDSGSLIENAITQLESLDKLSRLPKPSQYGASREERLFNVSLELVITWVNRILFLKLLEAQLQSYHDGDEAYRFLNIERITDFDDLNSLFFQVLARKHEDRSEEVEESFKHVPYLNSSLFDPTELEHNSLFISNLRDHKEIPIISGTVLKDKNGKKRKGEIDTLTYLFDFLEAYDFSSEGKEEIQEENKTLINASVLGLIFEKINGYKDGSFFTPGFITMYMCRETIRRSVVQKFNTNPNPSNGGTFSGASNGGATDRPSTGGDGVGEFTRPYQPNMRTWTTQNGKTVTTYHNTADLYELNWKQRIIPYKPYLKEYARSLRNEATKSERILWQYLKGKQIGPYDFDRQKPIADYIADFSCRELRLIIEVDGDTHLKKEVRINDAQKERVVNSLGFNVLRIADDEVFNNVEGVVALINHYRACFEKDDFSDFPDPEIYLNPLRDEDAVEEDLVPYRDETITHNRYETLDDVYDAIGRDVTKQQANDLVNSIKICDPAVGSGHFLVSALNEIIATKSDLKILQDRNGRTLRDYTIEVVNDELVITDDNGDLFEYHPTSKESQRVQEALFHEKQTIIENCLFGVDINANSVKICRLRLWIELLKSAYYRPTPNLSQKGPTSPSPGGIRVGAESRRLETLPNIDINIKCGNSLISRFDLDADLKDALKKSKWNVSTYRNAVQSYREAKSKEEKREFQKLIADIKGDFETEISQNDPKVKKLNKKSGQLYNLLNQQEMFDTTKKEQKKRKKQQEKLEKEIEKLTAEIEEIKSNKIYENAFEWRFEFPEVLDDDGAFLGFDCVIGNPPYVRQEAFSELKPNFKEHYETYSGTADLYVYFIERGMAVMRDGGHFHYIVPNKWMRANYGTALRTWLQQRKLDAITDFGDLPVFEEATTYPSLLQIQKKNEPGIFRALEIEELPVDDIKALENEAGFDVDATKLQTDGWSLVPLKTQRLLEKLKSKGTPLGEYVDGKIFYGIKTGYNKAFVIDEETKDRLIAEDESSAEIIKPFLAGRDIKRYQVPETDSYLILIKNGETDVQRWNQDPWQWFSETYPAVSKYLSQFEEKAKARYDQGQYWWELRACSYYDEFERPKIIYSEIATNGKFMLDTEGNFGDTTVFIIAECSLQLLAFLNAKLFTYIFSHISSEIRGGYLRWKRQYMENIPVREDLLESEQIKRKVDQILTLKKANPNADISHLEAEVDQLVYELYGLNEEEIAIVEGSV